MVGIHIENETERVGIMEKLLLMLLVAFDPRKNPAARLLSHQASVASKAIGDLVQSLSSLSPAGTGPRMPIIANSHDHRKRRKHGGKKKCQPARKYAQIKKIK